jgi:hypothetical protein
LTASRIDLSLKSVQKWLRTSPHWCFKSISIRLPWVIGIIEKQQGWSTQVGRSWIERSNYLSFETAWRKKPEYQGGFLLDGGVHFIAGTRVLLGPSNPIVRLSAFTKLTRDYLPPVDTVNAIMKTETGITGSLASRLETAQAGASIRLRGRMVI